MGVFYKENFIYFEKIIKKKYGKQVRKPQKSDDRKLQMSLVFAGKKYSNYTGLKTQFKNMISKTRNGCELDKHGQDMLKELLTYHDKADQKMKDLKTFIVDFHPVYKQTRCFFIVRENDEKEDFSLHKCL